MAEALEAKGEQLDQGSRDNIQTVIRRLSELDLAPHSGASKKAIAALVVKLTAALKNEQLPTPQELASELAAGRPRSIPFDDAHRTLTFSHDLSNPAAVSAAFRNLADFGGLDLYALQYAIQANDSGAIDELERHLHYEAQADIVSMFDARTDVTHVIYSTHSIGSLPHDLGRGVRVIVPDTQAGTSAINNLSQADFRDWIAMRCG